MTRLLTLCGLAITLSACHGAAASSTHPLPFYDEATFTPRWAPVAHHLAVFALTAQDGTALTDDRLRGRIHIASFVYTRCAAVCPLVVRELTKVQAAIAGLPDVVLVSYSVTPDTDTPAMLAEFGRDRSIDPRRWWLATGDRQQIWRLARESYFADDARELEGQPSAEQAFLHTEKVLLVDRELRLRGVYNGTSASDMAHLIEDTRQLFAAE